MGKHRITIDIRRPAAKLRDKRIRKGVERNCKGQFIDIFQRRKVQWGRSLKYDREATIYGPPKNSSISGGY